MNTLSRFLCTLLLATVVSTGFAAPAPAAAGLDATRLAEIPKRMEGFVKDNTISGAVTLVMRHGELASLEAVGASDLASGRAMKKDDLFWIASMTKPITGTAILVLQDEGKLSVEDPVEKYLPEFQNQWLIEEKTDNALKLKKPARKITIRDLLTHSSGINDVSSPRHNASLAELVMAYSQLPLRFEPGSRWEYSNAGINTLGRIVEVVSGKPYATFLSERFFQPLGMKDTTFWPSKSQLKRIAKSYRPTSNGKGLEAIDIWFFKGELTDQTRTAYPAGGLFSTASDMAKFYQLILNGGKVKGKQIVSQAAIDQMTSTQTGDLKTGFTNGMSFGFSWAVVKEPKDITSMLAPGTFGHGGAYGTQGWVDREKDMIMVLMIQRAGLPNADNSDMRRVLQEIATSAIVE